MILLIWAFWSSMAGWTIMPTAESCAVANLAVLEQLAWGVTSHMVIEDCRELTRAELDVMRAARGRPFPGSPRGEREP